MHIKVGLVGLPNVGKSSLFNALTSSFVLSENYPFCTIDPNVSRLVVPDSRIDKLVEIDKPNKVVNPTIEIYDIAGLVKGASKGEGLGNLFLSHIREVDLIVHVVRFFNNSNIIHVENRIDPIKDVEIINLELILKDIESIDRRIQKLNKNIKAKEEIELLNKVKNKLENFECNDLKNTLNENETKIIKELELLTLKPVIYVCNIDENIDDSIKSDFLSKFRFKKNIIFIPVKLGTELNELKQEEKSTFIDEVIKWNEYVKNLVKAIYENLKIITFYTSGADEVRGWQIYDGTLAPKASAEIHTDFEKHFIKVDVCKFDDYYNTKKCGGNPIFSTYGKDYKINDGDIVSFKVGI